MPPQEVHYKYDYAGRRLLKHVGTAGQRTRHFFNGLTEEIKKVSVGTHADTSFAVTTREDGTGTWSAPSGSDTVDSVYDGERFSDVQEFQKPSCVSGNFWRSGTFTQTERVASFWIKNQNTGCPPMVAFQVTTSHGTRYVETFLGSGTNSNSGNYYFVYLNRNHTNWQRVELDLATAISTLTPGVSYVSTNRIYSRGMSYRLDDVAFSNSMTVEHNTLGGGVIGHILRNRSINVAGYVPTATDRWFHYDQVGSVMATTNASGALSELRHPDAFGNRMASWQSGLWTNTYAERKGWGHNSKEFDADIGLVYMYQRWYNPELGLFGSKAPYPPMMEHQYGFAMNKPSIYLDPRGEFVLEYDTPGEFKGTEAEDVFADCMESKGFRPNRATKRFLTDSNDWVSTAERMAAIHDCIRQAKSYQDACRRDMHRMIDDVNSLLFPLMFRIRVPGRVTGPSPAPLPALWIPPQLYPSYA